MTVVGCLAFIPLVMGGFLHNISRDPGLTDEELRARGAVLLPRPRDISPFELTDAAGKPFTNANFIGHWSLVYFGFTFCPDVCPTSLADLAKSMPAISAAMTAKGEDEPVQVVFISVDPERDTTPVIANYIRAFSPDFLGAGGSLEKVAALGTQVNVAFGKVPGSAPNTYTIDHTPNVVLVNPKGHYHGFLRPPFTAQRLSEALPGLAARL
jgi:protein SCO1/2